MRALDPEVVDAVVRHEGLSTAEIATELFISAYTVQGHLKSIFDKVGLRSRRALVASLTYQHTSG